MTDHLPAPHAHVSPHAVFDAAWRARVHAKLDAAGVALLERAVDWVSRALPGTTHTSITGEPLVAHGAGVAGILADLGADAPTRASALLAALPVDASADAHTAKCIDADLRQVFDLEVVTLVQGAHALLRLGVRARQSRDTSGSDQQEMRRKMLLAMAADLRIVLLRLASRLQSLRWYTHIARNCPPAFAQETLELYTPLANRLGIWQLKWEMEDLALRALEPQTYKDIAARLEEKRVEREAFIQQVVQTLQQALHAQHITAEVNGRPKHIYSIWNKMRNKRLDFARLYDLRALRVIVDDERACYGVLALVHSLWTPVPEEFDDYISRPKPNGYRSLHTVVQDAHGKAFEVQIRTRAMHEFAEYGMAAHWRYKEAGPKGGQVAASSGYDQKVAWMRQLLAWDHAASTGQNSAQTHDAAGAAAEASNGAPAAQATPTAHTARAHQTEARIYVMTPQARVIELPEGATPIDFAYALHTDLGHRCRGARVNGQMVPLLTRLKTGQTVEITAAKSGGPSRDWLNPQLGFLNSPRARAKVRAWFNAVELQQRISQGQALVEKELQRLGKTLINLEQLAHTLGFAKADDLYVAVAKEEFSLRQIDHALRVRAPAADEAPHLTLARPQARNTAQSSVLVVGVDALLTQLARCCRPAPPDAIAGFITRGRGVSIHRTNCAAFAALQTRHPERIIPVAWGNTEHASYPVDIHIQAQDHPGLLHDLSEVFSRLRLRVIGVNTQSRRSLAHMLFTVEVSDGQQLDKVLQTLNDVAGVSARRR